MRSHVPTLVLVLTVATFSRVLAGDSSHGESSQQPFLDRFHPVGGWHPYGGGLTHWWNPHCFPCQSAPDDYCRKPLPRVCSPAYLPFYSWGTPEICYPRTGSPSACVKPH